MYSFGTLLAVLFALFATTKALECRPVMCMIACPFGFDLDAQGCPRCSCRARAVCVEPIFGYNCGSFDHRECPSSHECQLGLGGFTGQCCLKRAGSTTTARATTATTTVRATTATTTARGTTATTTGTSTRRALSRLLFARDVSTTGSTNAGIDQSTTGGSVTVTDVPSFSTTGSGSVTDVPSFSTTEGSIGSTFNWFDDLAWVGVGAK